MAKLILIAIFASLGLLVSGRSLKSCESLSVFDLNDIFRLMDYICRS